MIIKLQNRPGLDCSQAGTGRTRKPVLHHQLKIVRIGLVEVGWSLCCCHQILNATDSVASTMYRLRSCPHSKHPVIRPLHPCDGLQSCFKMSSLSVPYTADKSALFAGQGGVCITQIIGALKDISMSHTGHCFTCQHSASQHSL